MLVSRKSTSEEERFSSRYSKLKIRLFVEEMFLSKENMIWKFKLAQTTNQVLPDI